MRRCHRDGPSQHSGPPGPGPCLSLHAVSPRLRRRATPSRNFAVRDCEWPAWATSESCGRVDSWARLGEDAAPPAPPAQAPPAWGRPRPRAARAHPLPAAAIGRARLRPRPRTSWRSHGRAPGRPTGSDARAPPPRPPGPAARNPRAAPVARPPRWASARAPLLPGPRAARRPGTGAGAGGGPASGGSPAPRAATRFRPRDLFVLGGWTAGPGASGGAAKGPGWGVERGPPPPQVRQVRPVRPARAAQVSDCPRVPSRAPAPGATQLRLLAAGSSPPGRPLCRRFRQGVLGPSERQRRPRRPCGRDPGWVGAGGRPRPRPPPRRCFPERCGRARSGSKPGEGAGRGGSVGTLPYGRGLGSRVY